MKPIVVGMLTLLLLTGCSGLMARGASLATIDQNAADAATLKVKADAGQLTKLDAGLSIKANADKLNAYADAATTNALAYLFGGKTILCNAKYFDRLTKYAAASSATAGAADAGAIPDGDLNPIVASMCKVLIRIKDAKDGKAGLP